MNSGTRVHNAYSIYQTKSYAYDVFPRRSKWTALCSECHLYIFYCPAAVPATSRLLKLRARDPYGLPHAKVRRFRCVSHLDEWRADAVVFSFIADLS